MRVITFVAALLMALLPVLTIVQAAPLTHVSARGKVTGLPLPRFVSLKADRVNLRRGPGLRYPIEWVLRRRHMPVEILREFFHWRLVRLHDGTKGWIHQALLSGSRSFIVTSRKALLLSQPRLGSSRRAILDPGVIGLIRHCARGSAWCRVTVAKHDGWLRRSAFWGSFPGEAVGG